MFKLILLVLALIGGYVVLQILPDLQRYLRIRAM
jgi:muramoyltetrapeptide carboxypeptidase LdcA involved in peptidoglycan recycling